MAKKVRILKQACEVGTPGGLKTVKAGEECMLPNHIAVSMENKGLCLILDGVKAPEEVKTVEKIEVKAPVVKRKRRKKAAAPKKPVKKED